MLYGELSFDEEEKVQLHLDICEACRAALAREKSLHTALDDYELEPPATLLRESREKLRIRLAEGLEKERAVGFWRRIEDWFTIRPSGLIWKPAAALALVTAGFFGGRVATIGGGIGIAGLTDPVASRVSYVEPSEDGRIQLVVDETRRRVISGRPEEEKIRRLLLTAMRDPDNPGLRAESVAILNARAANAEYRSALVAALLHDQNAGVRLKALEGLKAFAHESDVRKALSQVLLTDANPGLRTQAIDLLTQSVSQPNQRRVEGGDQQIVGLLQELMRQESNPYVQQRCRRALEAMNASVEVY